VSSDQHPDCRDCGGDSVGETPAGPLCVACAQKRQHAARRIPCSLRYIRICDVWSTGVDEHGEQICDGCTRKRERLAQPKPKRPGGSRGAPQHIRKRVLARDEYTCQLRYPGVCVGEATEVDHIVNVAQVLARGGTRQQADHPSNLCGVCTECHSIKTERERATASTESNRRRAAARRDRLRLPAQRHPGDR
jgi:5-methylcytosine-specific restriction endonuclease McrA